MRVTVIGCGYVGLTTSVTLAYIGHQVHCIDQDENRIRALQKGIVPVHEKGVSELLGEVKDHLTFGDWDSFDQSVDALIIAVGTPGKKNGDADLIYVESVAQELGSRLTGDKLPVIVNKSTVPIGSARRVESVVRYCRKNTGSNAPVMVVSCPEFLREGAALHDSFYPDRIVVGSQHDYAVNILRQVYAPILEQTFNEPGFFPRPDGYTLPAFITTTPTSAELIKYAANTFLAIKISYINEIAGLAERVGADIREVARGIGLDKRIGLPYLNAGVGWGGSCFGKDISALIHIGDQYDFEMLLSSAAINVNRRQRDEIIKKLQSALKVIRGSTIGLLGLSFKPGTDDLRDAPSLTIANRLIELGAHVKAYDPVAAYRIQNNEYGSNIECASDPEMLASGADALVLVTEWSEFMQLPYEQLGKLMRQKVIIDGRNVLDSGALKDAGFVYLGVGIC
ncbi:MAG: UDP-glucose 6-dehydrogenase [Peptococcaceae bacterium BRH_c8a]|nr:MAG: UDP-glucose 6-dehydrogenase [Peptococcaceae bacterium BRH_c8a]